MAKPHSLSYQAETFAILPSTTFVKERSIIEEWGLWLKSEETSCSLFVSIIFFKSDFEAFDNELFISSTERFFLDEKTNSTKETFGVGTLIEIPSTLPFNPGITSPRDFVAPVVVGIIELGALLALLKSLWELSNNFWSAV